MKNLVLKERKNLKLQEKESFNIKIGRYPIFFYILGKSSSKDDRLDVEDKYAKFIVS